MENPLNFDTLKKIVYLRDLIPSPDAERIRFPGGVVCEVLPNSKAEKAKRVETILSNEKSGILKEMYVAYASNSTLLDIARRSDYVVEVRSIDWKKRHEAEAYSQDMLVLKRFVGDEGYVGNRILAPSVWMEKMGVDAGDHIIVSNPLSRFRIPLEFKKN